VSSRHHLQAGLSALLLTAVILAGGIVSGLRMEQRYIHIITPELGRSKDTILDRSEGIQHLERVKNQGLALQRQAFQQRDLLPLYGSSELMKPIPDKASQFFKNYPTGFSVFPVGKAGATSIILLQKIAAANPPRKSRLAVSLSPGWFTRPIDPHYYDGNFSPQQAMAMLYNERLSFDLKRDISRRLLEYPATLEKEPLLRFTAHCLSTGKMSDRALYYSTVPLGELSKGSCLAQDHFETLFYILSHRKNWEPEPAHQPASLDWDQLITTATEETPKEPADAGKHHWRGKADREFAASMSRAPEWDDFDLMLRVLKELHVRPVMLSMPPPVEFLGNLGVTPETVATYMDRVERMAQARRVPIDTFRDHFGDTAFLWDTHDHLSIKGWMYFNRALDDFYHTTGKKHLSTHRKVKSRV
jgi:D-alanine transfer protein